MPLGILSLKVSKYILCSRQRMPSSNYAVRLRSSYETLITTVADWALKCDKILCYEHPEKTDNIHCHLLLYGVYDSTDTLKRLMRSHGIELKGAGQISFKTSFKLNDGTKVDITDETIPKYITYMSKGIHNPKYNKGYEQSFVDACKAAWVVIKRTSKHVDRFNEFCKYMETINLRCDTMSAQTIVHYHAVKYIQDSLGGYIHYAARKDIKDLKDNYLIKMELMYYNALALPCERLR